jgi:hypothetical protein
VNVSAIYQRSSGELQNHWIGKSANQQVLRGHTFTDTLLLIVCHNLNHFFASSNLIFSVLLQVWGRKILPNIFFCEIHPFKFEMSQRFAPPHGTLLTSNPTIEE